MILFYTLLVIFLLVVFGLVVAAVVKGSQVTLRTAAGAEIRFF